jgi:hypothetical protein
MAISIKPYFGGVTTPAVSQPRTSAQETVFGGVANALGRAAQAADNLAEEEAVREANKALLKAQGDAIGFRNGLRGRQDYNAFGAEWEAFAGTWKAQNLDGLSRRARDRVEARIDGLFLNTGAQVQDQAWATQVDVSRADFDRMSEDAFRIVGQNPNSPEAELALGTLAEQIDEWEDRGFYSAVDAQNLRQATRERYGTITVGSLIESDPYGARKALKEGAFDTYLTPEKKLQLANAAEAEIKRREAEARARAAEANALWLDGFEDLLAFTQAGNPLPADNPYTREALVTRLGAEKGGKLADAMDYASAYGAKYASLSTASAEERRALIEQEAADLASPEGFQRNAKELEALQAAAKDVETALAADPAKYAVQNSPTVRAAYDEMVDAMQNPGADQALAAKRYAAVAKAEIERLTGREAATWLPASYLAVVSQQFASQEEGGENAAQVMSGLQEVWGRQWPDVYRQLVQSEALPAEAVMIGSGMAEGPAARLAEVARVPMDELKKGLAESEVTDVREGVDEALAEFRVVTQQYAGGEKQFGVAYTSVQKLALSYVRDGVDPSDAVERAYNDVIGSRYSFHGTFFVPTEQDPDAVAVGADAVRERIGEWAEGLDVPTDIQGVSDEARRAAYVSTLAAGGYWITSPEQDGLMLLDPTGTAVTVGGKPVMLTWDQLKADERGQVEMMLKNMGLR